MPTNIFAGATNIKVLEDAGQVLIPVKRTGDLSQSSSFNYGVVADTATADVDFDAIATATATFAVGQSTVFVPVAVYNNPEAEATEAFVFSITGVSNAGLSFPRTTRVTISDAQNPPPPDPVNPPFIPDYTVTANVVANTNFPVSFEWTAQNATFPNRLMYVADKGGVISVFQVPNGGGNPQPVSTFIDISAKTNDSGDRGLLDIALHPDFGPANPYIYAFYTVDPPQTAGHTGNSGPNGEGNRYSYVVRFTADANNGYKTVVPGSEVILLGGAGQSLSDISGGGVVDSTSDGTDATHIVTPASDLDSGPNGVGGYRQNYLKADSLSHVGGSLTFGPDGKLYVGVGDGISYNTVDPRGVSVQNVNALAGKILRIDPITGNGLSDNPFWDGNAAHNASKVWQMGLRNPYALTFDSQGDLIISETGWSTWEEINSGPVGANFGWPFYEGGDGGTIVPTAGYGSVAGASAFYAAVASGSIVITPAFRAFAHDSAAPGYQFQAIVGASSIYANGAYPAELNNTYFFVDIVDGELFAIDTNTGENIQYLTTSSGSSWVHFAQGPDGYMYYADMYAGQIGRFVITAGVVLTGTSGNNTLNGGRFADTISGLGGVDNLFGNGGGDFLKRRIGCRHSEGRGR